MQSAIERRADRRIIPGQSIQYPGFIGPDDLVLVSFAARITTDGHYILHSDQGGVACRPVTRLLAGQLAVDGEPCHDRLDVIAKVLRVYTPKAV